MRRRQEYDGIRPKYRPHIWVENENKLPSSITMYAISRGSCIHKRIYLPNEIPDIPVETQLYMVRYYILENREKKRYNYWFGKATEFIYRPDKRTNVYFDVDGEYLRTEIKVFSESEAAIIIH